MELGVISALTTVLFALVAVPLLAETESWLRRSNPPSAYVRVIVEEIDGGYYRPGTIDRLYRLRQDTTKALSGTESELQLAANAGFDAMATNVDRYLDIYYSLPAEYIRIANLIFGEEELSRHMSGDLNEVLMAGAPFAAYDAWMDAALKSNAQVQEIYAAGVKAVLEKSAVDNPSGSRVEISARALTTSMTLPVPTGNLTTTGTRAMVGSAAGAAVAAVVTKKLVSKGVLKLASKAFAKAVLSKSGGALGGAGMGAGAGAVVGSAVPGLGTAAGAIVGGVIGGLGVGVAVDYVTLKLEESFSRESFKQEILSVIEQERATFIKQLTP